MQDLLQQCVVKPGDESEDEDEGVYGEDGMDGMTEEEMSAMTAETSIARAIDCELGTKQGIDETYRTTVMQQQLRHRSTYFDFRFVAYSREIHFYPCASYATLPHIFSTAAKIHTASASNTNANISASEPSSLLSLSSFVESLDGPSPCTMLLKRPQLLAWA